MAKIAKFAELLLRRQFSRVKHRLAKVNFKLNTAFKTVLVCINNNRDCAVGLLKTSLYCVFFLVMIDKYFHICNKPCISMHPKCSDICYGQLTFH